jgi:Fic family protein
MYIHQRKDCPNFYWDNVKILPLIAAVRHSQGQLLGRMREIGFN